MRVKEGKPLKIFPTQKCLESCRPVPETVLLSRLPELLVKLISLGRQSRHPVLGLSLNLDHLTIIFFFPNGILFCAALFRVSSRQFNEYLLYRVQQK